MNKWGRIKSTVNSCDNNWNLFMRYRDPFTLYQRTMQNGKKIWYYTVYDEYGRRKYYSTGHMQKTKAKEFCFTKLRTDSLMQRNRTKFAQYVEDFFEYEKSPYIQYRLMRGFTFSKSHSENLARSLKDILVPEFGKYNLKDISPKCIENWLFSLSKKNYSNRTINSFFYILKVILSEAKRLGDIEKNPTEAVKPLANNYRAKGVLVKEEVSALFDNDALNTKWEGNELQYILVKILSKTGMRVGEAQALQKEDVKETHITVRHSWDRKYGIKGTKTGKVRTVPIDEETYKALYDFSMKQKEGSYIFSFDGGKQPVDHKCIQKWYYRALKNIGITDEIRRERNLTLHSWRYYVNSQLRLKGIPDSVVQSITGHSTQSMTEHYTQYSTEDLCNIFMREEEGE